MLGFPPSYFKMQKPFLRCGPYIPRLVINPGSSGLSAPRRNAHAAASWGQAGQGPQPRSRLNGDQGEHGWGGDRGEPCSQPGREQARDAAPTQQPPPRGDTLRSGPTGGAPSRGIGSGGTKGHDREALRPTFKRIRAGAACTQEGHGRTRGQPAAFPDHSLSQPGWGWGAELGPPSLAPHP